MSSFKRTTDGDVRRHMAPVLAELMRDTELGQVPGAADHGRTGRGSEPRGESSEPQSPHQNNPCRKKEAAQSVTLSDQQREFLGSIVDRPLLTMTQRAAYLGLSAHRCNEVKKELTRSGLIEEVKVNLGRQTGGSCTFVELMAAGAAAIGATHEPRPANCSAEHAWWSRHVMRWYLSQDIDARTEWRLGNARADVGVQRNGTLVAIEVAMTAQHEVANVKRDLAAGFARVYVACANARVKRAVEERLAGSLTADERARVQVMLLSDFSFVKELTRP